MRSLGVLMDQLAKTGNALWLLAGIISATVTTTVAAMLLLSGIWAAPRVAAQAMASATAAHLEIVAVQDTLESSIRAVRNEVGTLKIISCQTLYELRDTPNWEDCVNGPDRGGAP